MPPKEPFAYMSGGQSPIPKIRTPVLELMFGFAILGLGVYEFVMVLRQHGPIAAGLVPLIGLGSVGAFGMYVGLRRLLWKREYRRVMGRPPW